MFCNSVYYVDIVTLYRFEASVFWPNKERVMIMDYFEAYRSLWLFHKKFFQVQNTDEYWKKVVEDAHVVEQKYRGNKFVLDVLVAIIAELESRTEEVTRNAGTQQGI